MDNKQVDLAIGGALIPQYFLPQRCLSMDIVVLARTVFWNSGAFSFCHRIHVRNHNLFFHISIADLKVEREPGDDTERGFRSDGKFLVRGHRRRANVLHGIGLEKSRRCW